MISRGEWTPLKQLVSSNDETLPETTSGDLSFRYLEISDVSLFDGVQEGNQVTFSAAPSRARRIVRSGDVLVSTVRTYLRAIASIVDVESLTVVSTGFAVLRAQKVDPVYLRFSLMSQQFVDEVIARSTGVSYPAISTTDLIRIKIFVPPAEEQRAIADFLDRETAEIDAFIADQERLIELLTERRTATITHAVTKGLDPSVPMRDSGIPWLGHIPAHWQLVPVKMLVKLERGAFKHRPRNARHLYDGPYPFIQTGSVARNAGRLINEFKQTLSEAGLETSKMFPKGSLMMAIAANIGDVAVLGFDSCAPDSLLALIPQSTIDPWYLVHLMTAAKPELTRLAPVSTQGNLNVEIVGAVRVPLPSELQQREVLDYLDHELRVLDESIADAKQAIELSKERRAALISAAVTGQIDVRTHA